MRKICCLALLLAVATPSIEAKKTSPAAFTGEVVMRSIDSARIAVFLDSNGDHVVDNGFLLTTDIPMGNVAVRLAQVKLVFTDGYVRITSDDKKVWDLQVAGYPDPPAAPKDSKLVTLIGSALTHSKGDGCNLDRAEQDAGACYAYGRK